MQSNTFDGHLKYTVKLQQVAWQQTAVVTAHWSIQSIWKLDDDQNLSSYPLKTPPALGLNCTYTPLMTSTDWVLWL